MLNSRKYTFVAQLDVFNSEMAGRVVTKIYRLGWTIEAAHVIARRLLRCVVGDTWLYLSPFSIYIAVWTCTGLSLNTGITSSFTKMGVGPMVRPALTSRSIGKRWGSWHQARISWDGILPTRELLQTLPMYVILSVSSVSRADSSNFIIEPTFI